MKVRVVGDWPGAITLRRGWARADSRPWNDSVPLAHLRMQRGNAAFIGDCVEALQELGAPGVLSPPLPESAQRLWLEAKFRPHARILAVTPLLRSYRALSLLWGVVPIKIDPMQSAEQSVGLAASIAQESGRVNSGECYIITGGVPVGDSGTTNSITTAVLP